MTKAVYGLKHIEYLSSKHNMSTSKASHCIYRQMISFCRWCFLLKILLLAYAKTSESSNIKLEVYVQEDLSDHVRGF